MTYPLVTDLAADGVPVAVTCRVLGFSKQGYYRWKANPVTERDWTDAHLVNAALDIHADDPAFGYRFIADELPGRASWQARTGSSAYAGTTASGQCSRRSGV
jgi:putative transposase